jgi:hypothetical protein
MTEILRIVQHTPLWVLAVLAVLIVFGVQALRQRTVPIWRLVIIPGVFIAWGIISAVSRSANFPILIVDWLITAAVGFAIAWWATRLDGVQIDRAAGRVLGPRERCPVDPQSSYLCREVLPDGGHGRRAGVAIRALALGYRRFGSERRLLHRLARPLCHPISRGAAAAPGFAGSLTKRTPPPKNSHGPNECTDDRRGIHDRIRRDATWMNFANAANHLIPRSGGASARRPEADGATRAERSALFR